MHKWQFHIPLVALLLTTTCSKPPGYRDSVWADWALENLTFSQKIGQLVFLKQTDEPTAALAPEVRAVVAGYFIPKDSYPAFRSQLPALKEFSKVPPLFLPDETWGFPSTASAINSPLPIAFAAADDDTLVEGWGQLTAVSMRSMGFHGGYMPIVDTRGHVPGEISSRFLFGQEEELLDRWAGMFTSEFQRMNCLSLVRSLPAVPESFDAFSGNDARQTDVSAPLNNSHLNRAVAAGADCIVIDPYYGRGTALDRLRLTGLSQSGIYDGLILVDASQDMAGTGYGSVVERIVEGADGVITTSGRAQRVLNAIANAVMDGYLRESRLNESLKRVLTKKQAYADDAGVTSDVQEALDDLTHRVSEASMTLLRDRRNVLPLQAERLSRILVVSVGEDADRIRRLGTQFTAECRQRVPAILESNISANTKTDEFERIFSLSEFVDAVVVALFDHWQNLTLPDSTLAQLQTFLRTEVPLVVVSFGDPASEDVFSAAPSFLCSWSETPASLRSACRGIFGEVDIKGRLPLPVPNYAAGHGLDRTGHSMKLIRDVDNGSFEKAFDILREAIKAQIFPGAQVAIVENGRLIASKALGRFTYDETSPVVTAGTVYDISSITKVAATTLCAMHLWEEGKLELNVPVRRYLPEFSDPQKDLATVKDLLTHTAGIERWLPLWERVKEPEDVFPFLIELPLKSAPGDTVVYSDFGFMLFGKILEKLSGLSLEGMTRHWFLEPMDLADTFFNPPKELRAQIPPTELRGDMKRKRIQGEVHDANAYFIGGVAAHAGLFSTAEDLAEIAQMLLNGGIYNHRRLLSPATINYWTQPQVLADSINHALGWDIPRSEDSSAGELFSSRTYGHLGFTGTSMWIDPERNIAVILLTNRTFPSKHRVGIHEVRRDFHNEVLRILLERQWRLRTN